MLSTLNATRFTWLSLLALAIGGSTGCQLASEAPEWSRKLFHEEKEAVVPTRMMVMWTDTVLHQPQKSAVRGFGARIYFYSEDDPEPVKVDGGLAVYAFDASEIDPPSPKPKRKFVFTADQFAEHMSQTSMGTSYSVWCPWDEVGGYNEQLSLIVRFEGRNGGVVLSDPTIKLLPGLSKPSEARQPRQSSVAQATAVGDPESSNQLAGYEKASEGSATKRPRRQTETIDLPPSFYRHLKGPPQPLGPSPAGAPAGPDLTADPSAMGTPDAKAAPATDSATADTRDSAAPDQRGEPDQSGEPDQGGEPDQSNAAAKRNASDKRNGSSLSDRPSKQSTSHRPTYPRRTLGDMGVDTSSPDTQHPISRGWIPQLRRTPRYGFPKQPAKGDRAQAIN